MNAIAISFVIIGVMGVLIFAVSYLIGILMSRR